MLSLVLFNGPAYRHIRGRQLFRRARLDAINAGFGAATPLGQREIAPFPRDAMAVKTVWAVVHAGAPTPISVWDGSGDGPDGNRPARWPRTVLAGGPGTPLDRFYHLPIGAADLAAVRAIDPVGAGGRPARPARHAPHHPGDPGLDLDDLLVARPAGRRAVRGGPAGGGRRRLAQLSDGRRLLDGDAGRSRRRANIAFNPYLETFAAGTRSNCMACHQGAVWTAHGAAPFLPVTRGPRAADDPRFAGATAARLHVVDRHRGALSAVM